MIEVVGKQGLLSAAQWNVVEFHTMNAGTVSFEHPDRMVFDLDPGEGVAWAQAQEAAQPVHSFLAQLGLPSYLKTSGGKGLHVVVPVRRLHDRSGSEAGRTEDAQRRNVLSGFCNGNIRSIYKPYIG